ncbi:MAG: TonB-dependent receptor [Acidobacteria bacterium]|jgi:iron complex outermembrane receptor protein|nr:TonB-dependent receptor [Acidobacteriota bacterium]
MRTYVRLAVLAATLAVVWSSTAFAQSTTGTVSGKVIFDATKEPVHGATVIIIGARRTITTSEAGTFDIPNVPVGTYEVIAQREHFSAARKSVTVTAGQTSTVEFALSIETVHENVTVTASASGTATTFESFNAITSLDSVELAKNIGTSLADALATAPGVSKRSFGPGSGRPIIRGFDGDRVLVMQDGIRTGDLSSQSGDHGVSIDAAGLDRLEVVKGPATLLFGSNAIGGVVNAVSPQDAFRVSPFVGSLGGLTFDASSADEAIGANGSIQYGRNGWTVWAGGGSRRSGDYKTPDATIENSASRLQTGRAGFGYVGNRAFFSAGFTVEDGRFGIPFAGLFHHHHGEDEAEEEGEEHEAQVDISSLRRDLRMDAGMRNLGGTFLDTAKLTFAYTNYGHDEIEIEDGLEAIGTEFRNNTTTLRGELEQKRRGRLTGRMGAEWFRRDFEARGEEALAPATLQNTFAGFVYEEMDFTKFRLQFGARAERTNYDVGVRPDAEEHEEVEGEEHHEAPPVRDRSFTALSGSLGLHTNIGTSGAFVVNLSGASRAPALEELYNFGPHVGNLAFEIGNPDLEVERTLGIDLSLRSRHARAQGELNVFAYNISNFVFLDLHDEEIDGLREADFVQADARFIGAEASGSLDLHPRLHLHGGASYVRAKLTEADTFLPRIPAFSARLEMDVPVGNFKFGPEFVFTADQNNVFGTETTTPGSTVVNLGASYLMARGHATHIVAFKAYNLTNETYRLHTSFIKDLAAEMGRGVKLTYSVKFF